MTDGMSDAGNIWPWENLIEPTRAKSERLNVYPLMFSQKAQVDVEQENLDLWKVQML